MPTTSKKIFKAVKEADGWLHLFTGKHVEDVVKRAWELYGDDIEKKVESILADWPDDGVPDNPYKILGAHPLESDALIKRRFREKCKLYHPDVSKTPDPAKFQAVVEAYEAIVLARHPKAPEDC